MAMAVLLLPPVVENFSDTLFTQNMPSNKKVLKYGGNWKASLSISQGLATLSHTPQTQLYIHKKFLVGTLYTTFLCFHKNLKKKNIYIYLVKSVNVKEIWIRYNKVRENFKKNFHEIGTGARWLLFFWTTFWAWKCTVE